MTKHNVYTEEERAAAYALFMQGWPTSKIVKELSSSERTIPRSTLEQWKQVGNWDVERRNQRALVGQKIAEESGFDYYSKIRDFLEQYKTLREKAAKELEGLTFESAADASRALHSAIQGEYKISTDYLAAQFVMDIIAAIREEISDSETLYRIGAKLRKLQDDYQRRYSSV